MSEGIGCPLSLVVPPVEREARQTSVWWAFPFSEVYVFEVTSFMQGMGHQKSEAVSKWGACIILSESGFLFTGHHMIIYSILNQHNGKRYIGFTSISLKRRRSQHLSALRCKKHVNQHLQSAWNQGDRYFLWVILEVCQSLEQMKEAEMKWISQYNTTDPSIGYNRTYGGDGCSHTAESKLKISQSRKGIVFSEEHCENIKKSVTGRRYRPNQYDSRRGVVPWNKGKPMSIEARQRMSDKAKERWADPMERERQRERSIRFRDRP